MEWLTELLEGHHRKELRLLEELMSTAADLTAAIDKLTASVAKVEAEIATLKNTPPPLIDQPTLDADTAAVQAAADKLNGL